MQQINELKCPACKNPLDFESIYSGECIICEFPLRTRNKQDYEFTLEVICEW